MRKVGAILLAGGLLVGAGYAAYYFFVLTARFIPLPLKITSTAVAVGVILLLISIAWERYQVAKEEKFKEIER